MCFHLKAVSKWWRHLLMALGSIPCKEDLVYHLTDRWRHSYSPFVCGIRQHSCSHAGWRLFLLTCHILRMFSQTMNVLAAIAHGYIFMKKVLEDIRKVANLDHSQNRRPVYPNHTELKSFLYINFDLFRRTHDIKSSTTLIIFFLNLPKSIAKTSLWCASL